MRRFPSLLFFVMWVGCGDSASDAESFAGFDGTFAVDTPSAIAILVIDDRPVPEAEALRAGVGPAVQPLALDLMGTAVSNSDRALWHPVDLRVVLAPASSTEIISSVTDPALAWTTMQATQDGAYAFAAAVAAHAMSLIAPDDGAFRPLARARDAFTLIAGQRAPANGAEASLLATLSERTPGAIGVAIVAAADDGDTESPPSLLGNTPAGDPGVVAGLVTSALGESGATTFPRLYAWAADLAHDGGRRLLHRRGDLRS
jgi:hypothetical protein